MRHGRAKAARKTLQYFKRTIGLKAPYSILVDATFVATLFQQKIVPVKARMDRILQTSTMPPPRSATSASSRGETTATTSPHPSGISGNKYFMMQESVNELKEIQRTLAAKNHPKAQTFQEACDWIKQECIVLKRKETSKSSQEIENDATTTKTAKTSSKPLTPAQQEFLQQIEDSEIPYVVASQDEDLLSILRRKGMVPIVRLANGAVLLLEHPSKQSQFQAKGTEQQKWNHSLPEAERALVELVRQQERNKARGVITESDQTGTVTIGTSHAPRPQQQKRIKKAKGPNPLSCKRKQAPQDGHQSKESGSKKRRKRSQKTQQEDDGDSSTKKF